MIRKITKTLGWIVGGIVGLAFALCLVVVSANWRDRDPSAAAVRTATLYRDRPAVADEDNAFIYLMGFEAPIGESPHEIGLERIAWIQGAGKEKPLDRADDPLPVRFESAAGRRPKVQEFLSTCGAGSPQCVAALTASAPVFEEWMASESWLLERYRELIARSGWREFVSTELTAPFPSYLPIVDGQRLLLLNASSLADKGDVVGVNSLLETDIRFWRNVLASSDTLLSKAIAASALQRHFEWGNLVLRKFPPGDAIRAMPSDWRNVVADSERSMRRCLTGEWMFTSALLAKVANFSETPLSLADKALAKLYQPQDSQNELAEYYWRAGDVLDAPLEGYEAAVSRASELAKLRASEAFPPRSVYNILGSLLRASGPVDFATYARRVADVEGVRRAALAAVMLREGNVPAGGVAESLSAAPLRNPYDDRPFRWDENDKAVIFRGLEAGERGEHRIYY